jgi:hypothetical protein
MRAAAVIGLLAAWVTAAHGDPAPPEYDFYVVQTSCKFLAASSTSTDKGIKLGDDATALWGCDNASGRKVSCDVKTDKAKPADKLALSVQLDANGVLALHDDNYVDWIWIDRTSHVATITTRILTEHAAMIATRMCQGRYLTADEMKALEAKPRPRP